MSKGLIVSGGYVNHDLLLKRLKHHTYDHIMAVDGGMNALWVVNALPDVLLGDFDSCHEKALAHFEEKQVPKILFPPKKDVTDTDLALEHMALAGITEVDLLGATGTRFDHSFANVMLLDKYAAQMDVTILDRTNRIRLAKQAMTLLREEGFKYLSLLPVSDEVTEVCLEGVAYPLHRATLLRNSSYAVSNEITDSRAKLTFDQGKLLVVQSRD